MAGPPIGVLNCCKARTQIDDSCVGALNAQVSCASAVPALGRGRHDCRRCWAWREGPARNSPSGRTFCALCRETIKRCAWRPRCAWNQSA